MPRVSEAISVFTFKFEATPDYHFEEQIGTAGHANADAKVEFPFWRDVQIDSWYELVFLLLHGAKRSICGKALLLRKKTGKARRVGGGVFSIYRKKYAGRTRNSTFTTNSATF